MKRRDFIKKGLIGVPVGMQWMLLGTGCTTARLDDRSPAGDGWRDEKNVWHSGPRPTDALSKVGATGAFVRYEVNEPGAAKHLASYAKAIQAMRAIDKAGTTPSNGLSWVNQATVHNDHCPHGGWEFFPWHRDYLSRFEQIIRKMSGDPSFCLPYWDWSANGGNLPAAFTNPDSPLSMAEQGSGPPYPEAILDPSRVMAGLAGVATQVTGVASDTIVLTILGAKGTGDFDSFIGNASAAGEIESGPHNGVHGVLGSGGGPMGAYMSPLDPIFWMHHCNVDRLWSVWQGMNPDMKDATKIAALTSTHQEWLNLPLEGFYDADGKAIMASRKASDMLDTTKMALGGTVLGYTYSPKGTGASLVTASVDTDEIWSPGSGRSPAANTPGLGYHLVPRVHNVNGIEAKFAPAQGTNHGELVFTEFKEKIQGFADSYMQNPAASGNLVFRLLVENCPRLPAKTVMRVFFYPKPGARPTFLANICSFRDTVAERRHNHGPTMNLVYDYTRVMNAMRVNKLTAYPEGETRFYVEFFQPGKTKLEPMAIGGLDFNRMTFNLVVDERVPNKPAPK